METSQIMTSFFQDAVSSHEPELLSPNTVKSVNRVHCELSEFSDREWNGSEPGMWPARWISHSQSDSPVVAAYRLGVRLQRDTKVRIHVTGDERYDLFLNGEHIALGSERGDLDHWFFESYDIQFPAGHHQIVARVWSLGEKAPFAQISLRHGFFLCPDQQEFVELLATGVAPWEAMILNGYEWWPPRCSAWGIGWRQIVIADSFHWGHENGEGEAWEAAVAGMFGDSAAGSRWSSKQSSTLPHHRLRPAMLPEMINVPRYLGRVRHVSTFSSRPVGLTPIKASDAIETDFKGWQQLFDGTGLLEIKSFTRLRVIVDLGDYYCARPKFITSGGKGASFEIDWSEALYENIDHPDLCENLEAIAWPKGNRDEIEGKYFVCPWYKQEGQGDVFYTDGGLRRTFTTLWWQPGRYVQIIVETGFDPLLLESFEFCETRYPLEMEGTFKCSDRSLNLLIPQMVRSMQMCSHETYMDCPFYEQLMYAGDTRLEILTTYVLTTDDRLPQKALKLFDWSRLLTGLTRSCYPSRVRQLIPPFSLWWVAMCHDYALWRGDPEFVRSLLPGVHAVCTHFNNLIDKNGLLASPSGWNFTDWVVGPWPNGVPPSGENGFSSILNWHAVLVFQMAHDLESWFGEPEIAALQKRRAENLASATHAAFWNQERELYSDDLNHSHWSEHAQCLAILSGLTPEACIKPLENGLINSKTLVKTSIYFTHYLFEAYRKIGRMDALFSRLKHWQELSELGLKTTVEREEPTRSDCHAWGAHPLFHFYSSIAGVRPTAPGFSKVRVQPQLGPLEWLEATLPHPKGEIHLQITNGRIEVRLPEGVELENSSDTITI